MDVCILPSTQVRKKLFTKLFHFCTLLVMAINKQKVKPTIVFFSTSWVTFTEQVMPQVGRVELHCTLNGIYFYGLTKFCLKFSFCQQWTLPQSNVKLCIEKIRICCGVNILKNVILSVLINIRIIPTYIYIYKQEKVLFLI